MIVSSQDQEVADIIGKAMFGWAYTQIPDAKDAIEAVLKALRDNNYVITKVELPTPTDG
jgi:hypothetical protein